MNSAVKFSLFALILLCLCRTSRAQFAAAVVAYDAMGANQSFTDPMQALGPPSTQATPNIPDNSGIVSIGPNGSLILAFGAPLKPDATRLSGYDFIVFGNAFYVGGNVHIRYQKPAIVEVGIDANHNGYDLSDPFYMLQGSPNPMSGYPYQGVDDRQFTTWGYANVTPTNGSGDPLTPTDPFSSGISAGSAGGDVFKLKWAVDAQGRPVTLDHIDFIRIRSAGNWPCAIDAISIVRPSGQTISGTLALDGEPTAALLPVHVELRAPGDTMPLQTFDLPTGGAFTLLHVPPGIYDIAFKGVNTLRRVVSNVDLTVESRADLTVTLLPGDANGDNVCDTGDFGLLVGAYSSDKNSAGSGYDPAEDFNGDGLVDVSDFGLLIGDYGMMGDS